MLAYVTYLAIAYQSIGVFLGAYIVMSLVSIMALWPDENNSFKQKLGWSLAIPFLYFIFFIMDVVQIVSVFKCLLNHKKMRRIDSSSSTWVSPKRAGV